MPDLPAVRLRQAGADPPLAEVQSDWRGGLADPLDSRKSGSMASGTGVTQDGQSIDKVYRILYNRIQPITQEVFVD